MKPCGVDILGMLQSQNRLKTDRDFKTVLKQGRSFYSSNIKLKLLKNGLNYNRFGFIIGTRISKKATIRNRVKRQVREIIRLKTKQGLLKSGFDVVLSLAGGLIGKEYQEIEKEVALLLARAGLL